MIARHDLFNIIEIVIIFNILYDNFEVIIVNIFEIANKIIKEI